MSCVTDIYNGRLYTHKTSGNVDRCMKDGELYNLLYTANKISSCGFLGLGSTFYMQQTTGVVRGGSRLEQVCDSIKINSVVLDNNKGNGDVVTTANWTAATM